MTRTPPHLIRAAKKHAIGREQDVFLEGAKYGHANKTIGSDAFDRVTQGWPLGERDAVAEILFDGLTALGIGVTVDRPQEDE